MTYSQDFENHGLESLGFYFLGGFSILKRLFHLLPLSNYEFFHLSNDFGYSIITKGSFDCLLLVLFVPGEFPILSDLELIVKY